MEFSNALFEFFEHKGLKNLGRGSIELFRGNPGRMEQGDRVNGLAYLLAQSLRQAAQAESGLGAVGSVVADQVADFLAHEYSQNWICSALVQPEGW